MATNATQRLKKAKKHVRFADTVSFQKDADVSVEYTRVVNISEDQNEQVEDVVNQLDKMHLEALRCMDVHCEANEWRLNIFNVRTDAFDCLLQIVPAVSATVELDHAQVQLQALFNEITIKWQTKLGQVNALLNEFADDAVPVTNLLDGNDSSMMTAALSSDVSNLEASTLVN